MFIILEFNGILPEGFIGAVVNTKGVLKMWSSCKSAQKWAKKNCAFEYKIVEL